MLPALTLQVELGTTLELLYLFGLESLREKAACGLYPATFAMNFTSIYTPACLPTLILLANLALTLPLPPCCDSGCLGTRPLTHASAVLCWGRLAPLSERGLPEVLHHTEVTSLFPWDIWELSVTLLKVINLSDYGISASCCCLLEVLLWCIWRWYYLLGIYKSEMCVFLSLSCWRMAVVALARLPPHLYHRSSPAGHQHVCWSFPPLPTGTQSFPVVITLIFSTFPTRNCPLFFHHDSSVMNFPSSQSFLLPCLISDILLTWFYVFYFSVIKTHLFILVSFLWMTL